MPIDPKKPVRPYDLRNVQFPAKPQVDAKPQPVEPEVQSRTADAQRLAYDVLDVAHQQATDVASDKVTARGFERSLAAATTVSLTGNKLTLGTSAGEDAVFPLSPDLAKAMTLLPSNEPVLQALWAGERSSRVTLITAKAGAGASHAAAWLLQAVKPERHEIVRLTRTVAPDELVGALRPDEKQQIRVKDGPLTKMVRDGGTLVIDRLESASPEVLALLAPLANGARTFPHPVSHEVIPVNPDFRLVLVAAPDRALPPNLLQACQKNTVHVQPYGRDEHVRLLVEQHHLPPQLAASLADVHEQAAANRELDFGRNFPVTYGQLRRVALRLEKLNDEGKLTQEAAGRAMWDVYGARLANPSQKEAMREILVERALDPGPPAKVPASKSGYVVTPRLEEPLRQAMTALENNETLFISGSGQTGITRLVDELGVRRKQDVVTVPCHAGTDPQSLMEMPTFDENGRVYFKAGRLAQALLDGKLLCLDHIEFIPTERQNAFFHLGELKTIRVVEEIKDKDGKVTGTRTVEKPVHPNARVVLCGMEESRRLSSLHTEDRPMTSGLHQPTPADRACATEVALPPADVSDVAALLPKTMQADVRTAVLDVLGKLFPPGRAVKVQRAMDFANASALLAEDGGFKGTRPQQVAQAVEHAARLLFKLPGPISDELAAATRGAPAVDEAKPLWMRLLKLSTKDVKELESSTELKLVPSVMNHLDEVAIAFLLGRPVGAHGPPASGKTVLGAIFATLMKKAKFRVNFSSSTEARDFLGGLGPVNVDGRTIFKHQKGDAINAAEKEGVIIFDEANLSEEGYAAAKPMLDYRRKVIDAENDIEVNLGDTLVMATWNDFDKKFGRRPIAQTVHDCMFLLHVDAKPIPEKVEIVRSHTSVAASDLTHVAELMEDIERLVAKGKIRSNVGPLTFTERDILKAAEASEHFFQRDGVKDPAEQTRIVAREAFRVIADLLADPAEQKLIFDSLIAKRFGVDIPPFERASKMEVVRVGGRDYLQVGVARVPIRELGKKPELDKLIPDGKGLREPVGPQIAVIESLLLAWELKQPAAAVGITGTGKTMLMKVLARKLNWPVLEQPAHADMTKDDLLGAPALTKDRRVEFKKSPLNRAVDDGLLYILDEALTLDNDVREVTNPLTEGSELQIPSRPPRTIYKKDWDENFRFFMTTNGGDIRKADFSPAEASRLRIINFPEITDPKDFQLIGARDYLAPNVAEALALPASSDDPEKDLKRALKSVRALIGDDASTAAATLAELAKADAPIEMPATLGAFNAPMTEELASALVFLVKSARAAKLGKRSEQYTELVASMLVGADPALKVRARACFGARAPEMIAQALDVGAIDGKLVDAGEVKRTVDIFCALRDLQRGSAKRTVSPLTQRVFTSFMEITGALRERVGFEAAVSRAAALTILSKLGPAHEAKALETIVDVVGKNAIEAPASVPKIFPGATLFGDTLVKHGRGQALQPDNTQFPFTPARCKNLALCADALELGQGRPVSCNDDENGENVELWRQLGRLSGRQVTVVTLTKNVDIESLIEKLVPSSDPAAKGGFEPELQQIGEAVRQGHILVLRGCGNVPTTKLERLNSLGDGRQSLALPKSAPEVLSSHPDFRLVLMKKEGSPFDYSEAIQNRVLEPRLSTRAGGGTRLEQRAGELAGVVRERAGISTNAAMKLAAFHTYLNEVLKQGAFSSGRQVKSFLNRDAEAVAQRLQYLLSRGVVDDEMEALHDLVLQVYGERFTVDGDRDLLHNLAQRALGSDGGKLTMSMDAVRTPNLVRYGEWVATADPRGVREGVPRRDDVLPPTTALGAVQQRMFAALQFGEVVHLHGDPLMTQALTASAARLLTSPILEIDGNEGLAPAHLFGGLIQDQKTGKFERHEGAVWQAQRLGLTLVIKNASRIPDDVMLPLAEIAATKHLQRVVNGDVQNQACKFRLVLQTAETDPKPLVADLAQLVTRVSCPQIDDEPSVKQIVGHSLLGVPGGPLLSAELTTLVKKVAKLVEKEVITGRPELHFDAARTVEIAKSIARSVRAGASLESSVADALNNQILRPLTGLKALEKARVLVSEVGVHLADAGTLEAEAPPAVDDVDNPAKAQLLKDYSAYSDVLTQAAVRAVVEAVRAHEKEPDKLREVLRAASTSRVLPQAARAKLAKAAAGPDGSDIGVDTLCNSLTRMAPKSAAGENDEPFYEAILDFMRGARLSDVEHRTAIFGAYADLFSSLDSPSAQAHVIELERVSERFDAANALNTIETMRRKVAAALDNYRSKSGEVDDHLTRLFRELVETWDVVVMSPVFKEHHRLRQTIGELNQGLEKIMAVYEKRGESSAAIATLVEEVRVAGAMIEGVRIAEQSAELRRDITKSERATERIIDDLRGELMAIRELEAGERRSKHLTRQQEALARLRGGDAGTLKNASTAVDAVATRPDADIMAEARRQVERENAPMIAARRVELLGELQQTQRLSSGGLGDFFAGFQPDVGLAAGQSSSAAEPARNRAAYDDVEATLAREAEAYATTRLPAAFKELKKKEEERARKETSSQVEARVRQTGQRVKNAAKDLRGDLASISRELDLRSKVPALADQIEEVRDALDELVSRADGWMGTMLTGIASFVGALFGVKADKPKAVELDTADVAAMLDDVLGGLQEQLNAELAALPDLKSRGAREIERDALVTQLASASTYGELANKLARASRAVSAEGDEDLKRALQQIVNRVAGADGGRVLFQMAAFAESANLIATDLASKKGVTAQLAPVLEQIVRAAEAVSTSSLSDKSLRAPLKQLQIALTRIDELRDPPPVLALARGELESLISMLGGAAGTVSVDAAGIQGMLAGLGAFMKPKVDETAVATRNQAGESAVPERPETGGESALEASVRRSPQSAEGAADALATPGRITELKLVSLRSTAISAQLSSLLAQPVVDDEKSAELTPLRKTLGAAADNLATRAMDLTSGIQKQTQAIAGALSSLEASTATATLAHWRDELEGCARKLEAVTEHGGEAYRGSVADVGKALGDLRRVRTALASLDSAPPAIASTLAGVIESARTLSALPSAEFDRAAFAWARRANASVREAMEELASLGNAASSTPGPSARDDDARSLAAISEGVGLLAQNTGRLGAASSSGVLARTADRLESIASSLPEAARAQAAAVAEQARTAARSLARDTGGLEGERAAADLIEATIELCSKLGGSKKLVGAAVDAAVELANVAWGLCEQPVSLDGDLERIGAGIDAARALSSSSKGADSAREIDRTLGSLRTTLLERAIGDVKKTHEAAVAAYGAGVRETGARLREDIDALLNNDPLASTQGPSTAPRKYGEIVDALRATLTSSQERMPGPAISLWAREVARLADGLRAMPSDRQGTAFLAEIDPLERAARGILETAPDADDRFARMLRTVDERLRTDPQTGRRRQVLAWLEQATVALAGLMTTSPAELAPRLSSVESELFPDLAPASSTDAERADERADARGDVAGESAVGRMMRGRRVGGPRDGAGEVVVDTADLGKSDLLVDETSDSLREGDALNVKRDDLKATKVTEKSDKVEVVEVNEDALDNIRSSMDAEIAARRAALLADPTNVKAKNAFEIFAEQNDALVQKMAETLRQFPGTEIVFCVDQSGSCGTQYGDSTIIAQERAALATCLAAVCNSEANCAVLGTGIGTGKPASQVWQGPGSWPGETSQIFLHKPMSQRLDTDVANEVYTETAKAGGGENLIEIMKLGAGQFTSGANNKLLFLITDAALGDAADMKRYIDNQRAQGVGVCVMGFGAAQAVKVVAGEFGEHVKSLKEAVDIAPALLAKTAVDNNGRFQGKTSATAGGIGVAAGQSPLEAAASGNVGEAALGLAQSAPVPAGDPAMVYAGEGDRRQLSNLVDRARYDGVLRELEDRQRRAEGTPEHRKAVQLVREAAQRHKREGVHDGLVGAVGDALPRVGGTTWEKKQLSGPALDQDELPLYLMGVEQGVVPQRIFMRKKAEADVKAKVVIALDESTSMSKDKQQQALEAALAYGDALKGVDDEIQICVVGFGEKVKLHLGFEQRWTDENKAHIALQVRNAAPATDDERMVLEAVNLLELADAEVGQIVSFTDGQGMGGLKSVIESAEAQGYAFLAVGVGPESKAVARLGVNGVYARNLAVLPGELAQQAVKSWEAAGHISGGT